MLKCPAAFGSAGITRIEVGDSSEQVEEACWAAGLT